MACRFLRELAIHHKQGLFPKASFFFVVASDPTITPSLLPYALVMNSLQLPDHARQCFRGCFFDRESVSVLFAVLGLSLYHRYKNSWFWRDCTGRLENEPLGFQMAVLGAKMAFGFRAKNPETKADRCLPKLWGWQKGSHISPCQTTRLVIALSHAGGGEMPAKDGVAPALAKRSCAS